MALSNGFRLPLGDGNSSEAIDGDGYHVETNFGWYNPSFNAYHLGEDWNGDGGVNGDLGQPVHAISNSVVVERGVLDSFGNYVILRVDLPAPITANGITTSTVYVLYGHLQNPALVKAGDVVSVGQQIGKMGMTGAADGNAHVHLEIRLGTGGVYNNTDGYNGSLPAGWVDPTDFINSHRTFAASSSAPLLTGSSPVDGTIAVAVNSNIVLTFNEDITTGTGNVLIYNAAGSLAQSIAITDSSQVSVNGNTVTINPASNLAASSGYYINLAAGVIRDLAGNGYYGISGASALSFTTAAPDLAGNTRADARIVTLSDIVSKFADYVGPADTNDYYKFTTTGTTDFVLKMAGMTADADVYLLKQDGTEVTRSWNAGAANEAITINGLAAGTYFVAVRPYNTASTNYTLDLAARPAGDGTPPDLAGNTRADARLVTLNATLSGFTDYVGPADTNDYYRFTTAGTADFVLNMTNMTADADVYLLRADGTEVARSWNAGAANETITINGLATGTYFVAVRPYNNASTEYTLGLKASPVPQAMVNPDLQATMSAGTSLDERSNGPDGNMANHEHVRLGSSLCDAVWFECATEDAAVYWGDMPVNSYVQPDNLDRTLTLLDFIL